MGTTVAEEPLFSFPKLEPFLDSTFNTPVREEENLPATPFTPSVTHPKIEDDSNQLPLSFWDDDSALLRKSTKIRYKPTRYGVVAQYIALSSIAQSEICKLLSYNKGIWSPEAQLWKQAIDKEFSSLYENHT